MFSLLRKLKTHSLPFDLQIDLFKKTIEPIQLYGCEVWGNEKVDVLERVPLRYFKYIFITPPFEEWWRALSVTPVRPCVRPSVRASVLPSVIKVWCPLNNFWKTASIQLKFGMLIYNIKTQVKFELGYKPLIFDGVMGLL